MDRRTEPDSVLDGWCAVLCARQEEKTLEMCPYTYKKILLERVSRDSQQHVPGGKRGLSLAKRTEPRGSRSGREPPRPFEFS